jgi:uncharacterized protein (TIGR03083 family)
VTILDLTAAERRRAADLLTTLDDQQWQTQSLCGEWTVRDVAAHLTAGWNISILRMARLMLRHRGFDGANAAAAKELAKRSPKTIVDDLRSHADDPFSPPVVGHVGQLSDVIVHGQDIARPLGIDFGVDPAHVRPALGLAVGPKARVVLSNKHHRGLRFETTDQDWGHGEGPTVRGESHSILFALYGRTCDNDGLDGDGVVALRRRLSGP